MNAGVYLAQPIDQSGSTPAGVHDAVKWMSQSELVSWVFRPEAAFNLGGGARTPGIRQITSEAQSRSDVTVAFMPAGAVSIGVPMEIHASVSAGKPTLVISDAPSWILSFDPETEEHARVLPEWGQEAQEVLSEMLRGVSERTEAPRGALLPVVVEEGAEEPRRGYDDDAGLDLVVSEEVIVGPGEFVDIPCGVSAQLPDWSWGLIIGRSSTLRKRGLMVNQGVIDAGYRGPLFAGVWNLTDHPVRVLRGERVAQLVILENSTRKVEVKRVSNLLPGTRGDAGFGSTGT